MTKQELNQAILKVAEATQKSKWEVSKKLLEKDQWTWFLVKEASK